MIGIRIPVDFKDDVIVPFNLPNVLVSRQEPI